MGEVLAYQEVVVFNKKTQDGGLSIGPERSRRMDLALGQKVQGMILHRDQRRVFHVKTIDIRRKSKSRGPARIQRIQPLIAVSKTRIDHTQGGLPAIQEVYG